MKWWKKLILAGACAGYILIIAFCVGALGPVVDHVFRFQTQQPQKKEPDFSTSTTSYLSQVWKGPIVKILACYNVGEKAEKCSILQVFDKDDKLMVDVPYTGEVIYGPNYKPDEAAKTFWKTLAEIYPSICKAQQKVKPAPRRIPLTPRPARSK